MKALLMRTILAVALVPTTVLGAADARADEPNLTTEAAVAGPAAFVLHVMPGLAGKDAQPQDKNAKPVQTVFADRDITAAVERRLARTPTIPFDGIDVRTDIGVVTLTGTVDSLVARQVATDIAQETKGVRSVVNRLTVKAFPRTDEQLRKDVEQALRADPAADSYEITTTVAGGIVSLTGQVESWTERQVAEEVARGVKGVTAVNNQLTVQAPRRRPDIEIAGDVRSRLKWDRRVDDAQIDVQVRDGKVTLTGAVGSAAERVRAYADAWVLGVTGVDCEGLKVDKWWDRDGFRRDPAAVATSDAEIERAVRDALLFDPRVVSFRPAISVRNGTVTLTGTVENLAAKWAAEADARNTVGVLRVRNYLKVRPDRTVPDPTLAEAVRLALARDPYVDKYEIRVSAAGGYVYLSGSVDSFAERNRAEVIASRVNGVIDVRNRITITFPYPDLDTVPDITARDNEIKEDIEDQLYWSPYVDAAEVVVTVRGGIATLNGFVDSWSESRAAAENAIEGGARRVINELKVRKD